MTKVEILDLLDKTINGGVEMAIGDNKSDGYYEGVLNTVWTLIGLLTEKEADANG